MSTYLEFRQGLPHLRLPAARNIQQADADAPAPAAIPTPVSGGEECRTPTSPEKKIPTVLSCPPAPKKPRRAAQCKRKLRELRFFEIVGREEVDSFFRSVDLNSTKRRCTCS